MPSELDSALAALPYFRALRADERARAAARFRVLPLAPGASLPLDADAVLVAVLEGEARVQRGSDTALIVSEGDWSSDLRAVSGLGVPGALTAGEPSLVALLDRAGLEHLFRDLPVVAIPLVAELGREVKRSNDLLREVALARSAGLPAATFRTLVGRRRRRVERRHVSLARAGALVWRALVAEPSRRYAFWVFVGAVAALVSARTVVAVIIDKGLQKNLFALVASEMGHPVHVHHFNYGLSLIGAVGVLALWPRSRKAMRLLAFGLGFGTGLVVDEFALFWNLNPDYYQPSSRLAAALVLFALFQAVWFRALWRAVARRLLQWLSP